MLQKHWPLGHGMPLHDQQDAQAGLFLVHSDLNRRWPMGPSNYAEISEPEMSFVGFPVMGITDGLCLCDDMRSISPASKVGDKR